MAQWLDKLRDKPSAVRRQYSYIGSLVITGLIVAVWVTTQGTAPLQQPTEQEVAENRGAFGRFFADVKGQVAAAFSSLGGEEEVDKTEIPADSEENAAATTSQIFLPEITDETRAQAEAKQASTTASSTESSADGVEEAAAAPTTPRAVLIATSSAATAE